MGYAICFVGFLTRILEEFRPELLQKLQNSLTRILRHTLNLNIDVNINYYKRPLFFFFWWDFVRRPDGSGEEFHSQKQLASQLLTQIWRHYSLPLLASSRHIKTILSTFVQKFESERGGHRTEGAVSHSEYSSELLSRF